ncbi:MAG: hypothetical protein DMD50_05225 [Gemmatimonadetes bacterium]|nr:MAG: hypothetical protein DMD50_05225 [Gemmatimonadota bacterium]
MMKLSVSSAEKSGWKGPVRNETAVFTAEGLSSRTALRASFMVAPVSQVSSTISTRRPVTRRVGPAITTGRPPDSVRVMAMEAKSRCRMLATTAPGITPARAMPITTSGSYSRKILRARARHISPKNGQSTSRTPCGALPAVRGFRGRGAWGGGGGVRGGGGAGMGCEATLHSRDAASYFRRMGFWRRLLGGSSADEVNPQRLDYLNEALALERQGDYDAALTSYRLALRDHPNDARILQNMAIAFTKTRRIDEAIRHYRRALELDRELAGAHYGLAFLLLKRGDPDGAAQHLRAFLAHPPKGPDAQKWIEHATQALRDLGASGPTHAAAAEAP